MTEIVFALVSIFLFLKDYIQSANPY